MFKIRCLFLFIFYSCLLFSGQIRAEKVLLKEKKVWSISAAGGVYNYKFSNNHPYNLSGVGTQWSLFYGKLTNKYFIGGELNWSSGPFGQKFDNVSLDLSGISFGLKGGWNFHQGLVGSYQSNLGFLVSAKYQDTALRSYERSNYSLTSAQNVVVNYQNDYYEFSFGYGLFWSVTKEVWLDLQDPDAYLTRDDGYMITLQISHPFKSHYKSKITRYDNLIRKSDEYSGIVSGYTIFLSVIKILGV